ncbi:MAG: twin-arginine translocase TatA/TatE family subunit [Anaerolineae bacterium]
MPFRVGPLELVIILLIVVAIFGAGKLANLGGSVGKAVKDFRTAVKDPNKDETKKDAAVTPVEDIPAKSTTDSQDKPS